MITKTQLLTIADWDAMPAEDGYRYEIIEGELFVSCSPGLTHQVVLTNLLISIGSFLKSNPLGTVAPGPGVILSNYSGVCATLSLKMTACTGLHLSWSKYCHPVHRTSVAIV